jgi:RNA polymerase sigma-70 factor, ECF subfamily
VTIPAKSGQLERQRRGISVMVLARYGMILASHRGPRSENERDELGFACVIKAMALDFVSPSSNLVVAEPITTRGNTLPFEELFDRHYSDVFRYALVLTNSRDDADDVAAETFARAWNAYRRHREPEGPPLPWLFTIARNITTDWWRRLSRRGAQVLPHAERDSRDAVEALLWLESLMRALPARQREVIALRYHRDLSDREIGRIMGLSESGVRSLAARAIQTLRQHPEVWR